MRVLWKLLPVLGANLVVLWGLGLDGWSGPTALAVYWFENLLGAVLITVRIGLHRRWTKKQGHYRGHYEVEDGSGRRRQQFRSLLAEFAAVGSAFTLAHGVFLGIFLYGIMDATPDPAAFGWGAAGVAGFQLVGFVVDLLTLRGQPFAWIKRIAGLALARVMLVHVAILIGVFATGAAGGGSTVFVLPFAGLKRLSEIAMAFGEERRREHAPGWLVELVNRLKPGFDFAAYLAAENVKELAREAEDEQIVG